jgi:hypothetical protein
MSKVHIADRNGEALAKVSYSESARFKHKKTAWRAPWPPRPPPKVVEAEPDDLLLRAAQAALRRGDVR